MEKAVKQDNWENVKKGNSTSVAGKASGLAEWSYLDGKYLMD